MEEAIPFVAAANLAIDTDDRASLAASRTEITQRLLELGKEGTVLRATLAKVIEAQRPGGANRSVEYLDVTADS